MVFKKKMVSFSPILNQDLEQGKLMAAINLKFVYVLLSHRPLSRGGHFESQGNKKLCFCTSSLALNERLDVQNLLFEHCVIKVYSIVFMSKLLVELTSSNNI